MKNKLSDLNNHLFAQLERLGDEDITGETLNEEINRAKAVTDIAQQVILNANLALKAQTLMYEYGIVPKSDEGKKMPFKEIASMYGLSMDAARRRILRRQGVMQ